MSKFTGLPAIFRKIAILFGLCKDCHCRVLRPHKVVSPLLKVTSNDQELTQSEQIMHSKPKWEITKITNSQYSKRTSGQPSEQLFPKRWPLCNLNRSEII